MCNGISHGQAVKPFSRTSNGVGSTAKFDRQVRNVPKQQTVANYMEMKNKNKKREEKKNRLHAVVLVRTNKHQRNDYTALGAVVLSITYAAAGYQSDHVRRR